MTTICFAVQLPICLCCVVELTLFYPSLSLQCVMLFVYIKAFCFGLVAAVTFLSHFWGPLLFLTLIYNIVTNTFMSISPLHFKDFEEKIIDSKQTSMQNSQINGSLMGSFRSDEAGARL